MHDAEMVKQLPVIVHQFPAFWIFEVRVNNMHRPSVKEAFFTQCFGDLLCVGMNGMADPEQEPQSAIVKTLPAGGTTAQQLGETERLFRSNNAI